LEQAEIIRKQILHQQKPEWEVLQGEALEKLKKDAFHAEQFNKKSKERLFEYALIYDDLPIAYSLVALKYQAPKNMDEAVASILRKRYADYQADSVNQVANKTTRYGIDYRDEFNFTPMMAAVFAGSLKITKYLLDNGANTNLMDNNNRTPLQIALYRSRLLHRYAKEKIGSLYGLLRTESISVKINDKLVKIGNHKMEYLVLHYLIAVQMGILKKKSGFVQCDHLLTTFEHYSENVLPAFRKKRSYISAILAKNERNSNQPYNLKLLVRVRNGHYVLNPHMEIRVNDEWRNVYDLMGMPSDIKKGFFDLLRID
jgi:Ankyrin repeats (many copies)